MVQPPDFRGEAVPEEPLAGDSAAPSRWRWKEESGGRQLCRPQLRGIHDHRLINARTSRHDHRLVDTRWRHNDREVNGRRRGYPSRA